MKTKTKYKYGIGDLVRNPYGEVMPVLERKPGYHDRADNWVDDPWYRVDTRQPGSVQVWWTADQLESALPLTEAQEQELENLLRWEMQARRELNHQIWQLEEDYSRKLQQLIEKHRAEQRHATTELGGTSPQPIGHDPLPRPD